MNHLLRGQFLSHQWAPVLAGVSFSWFMMVSFILVEQQWDRGGPGSVLRGSRGGPTEIRYMHQGCKMAARALLLYIEFPFRIRLERNCSGGTRNVVPGPEASASPRELVKKPNSQAPNPHQIHQKLWEWGPVMGVLTSPLTDSGTG